MLRLAFDFIITWRETRTRPNAYLWASAIGACTLSLGSCTDLSETIYDTVSYTHLTLPTILRV